MPTYEFECSKGHSTDVVCRISDRANSVACGQCGGATNRVYSLSSLFLLDEYQDAELSSEQSAEPYVVKNWSDKQRRLKQLGLEQVPITAKAKDRQMKHTIFSIGKG